MRRLTLLLLFWALSAVAGPGDLDGYSVEDVDSGRVRPGMNGRQTWTLTGIRDYVYTLEARCYCDLPGRTRIYVLGGLVTKVVDLSTSREYVGLRGLDAFPTIPELFGLIDTLVSQQPDRLTIEHDRWLGYPIRIFADPSRRLADDEIDYRVSDLKSLQLRGNDQP